MVDFATHSLGVATMYLFTGEGLSTSNKVLLARGAQITATFGDKWVIGGDMNFSPVTMLVSGFLRKAKACVASTRGPTYTSGQTQSNID